MLTKGIIITKDIKSNKYIVRIPFLETSGMGEKTYEAIASHTSSSYDEYKKDDVVIIGFEDHNGDKPIILGKLLTNETINIGSSYLLKLDVKDSVKLPKNITIGDIEYSDLINAVHGESEDFQKLLELINQNTEKISELEREIELLKVNVSDLR